MSLIITIVMLGFLVGTIAIAIGWVFRPKNMILIGSGALTIFGAMIGGAFGTPSRDAPDGNPFFIVLGFIIIAIGMCLMVLNVRSMLKKSKYKRQSEIGGTDLDKFFVECTLASYTNFDLKSHKEKAERIADKYKLSYIDGIEKLYEKGLKAHKIVSDRLIKEFTKIEENEYTISKRYATLYGTEKRISMLTEIKKEIENESDSLAMSAEAYLHSTQKKEMDWAVGAGIADGLAGTGAAVLTAIDIQAKNAEIRAQNKENLKMAMPIYTSIIQNSYERIAYVTEKIKSAKQKQLSDKSSAEVFNMLEFTDSKITISDTGAFLVNTTVQVKKKLDNIFGDLPATIDGTIIAHIYENSTEVAKVNMILPIDGVFNKANISGVAPSNALPEKSYTIKFSAGNLWLMEK